MKELLENLIGKVVDSGTAIQDIGERIGKIPDPGPALRKVEQQVELQTNSLENVVKSQSEVRTALAELTRKVTIPSAEIKALQEALERHAQLFERPLEKTVHYKHFLGRAFYVMTAMVIVILLMSGFANREWERAERHAKNDIKWRAFKNYQSDEARMVVREMDSLYLADPEKFETETAFEEDRLQQLWETREKEYEAQQKIEQLNKQKKTK